MCGRFAFYSPREAVKATFGVEFPLEFEPRYNITPSQYIPVLRGDASGELAPAMLRWGLVPSWAKDPSIGQKMINARAETVAEKPSFRAAYRRRRCVILADGFYEWQQEAGARQPWYITAADRQPFAMAGLWEHWDKGDEPLQTCAIITTAANAFMTKLHHRMPVILTPDAATSWIRQPDAKLLRACDDDRLLMRRVSRRVNSPANDGPELIVAED